MKLIIKILGLFWTLVVIGAFASVGAWLGTKLVGVIFKMFKVKSNFA